MSFDLQRIIESKRAYRQRLAALSIAEKLRMLDALRARTLSLLRHAERSKIPSEFNGTDENGELLRAALARSVRRHGMLSRKEKEQGTSFFFPFGSEFRFTESVK